MAKLLTSLLKSGITGRKFLQNSFHDGTFKDFQKRHYCLKLPSGLYNTDYGYIHKDIIQIENLKKSQTHVRCRAIFATLMKLIDGNCPIVVCFSLQHRRSASCFTFWTIASKDVMCKLNELNWKQFWFPCIRSFICLVV